MYDAAYHLNSDPFRLSPDHRFCFRHSSYTKNKAYLDYALERGEGFVMITGTPGSGKTTLLNDALTNSDNRKRVIARIVTTQLNATELLRMVAFSFKLDIEDLDKASIIQHLEKFLIEQHHLQRSSLLVIDEAQDLDKTALEEIRLLTNLQINDKSLLQIFLVGQENLLEIIQDPKMEQLHQRLIASSHLEPMDVDETAIYVMHRLRTAGWRHDPVISRGALRRIHFFCRGVPRRINQLCSRFLLYGAVENKHRLDSNDIQEVINELRQDHLAPLSDNGLPDASSDERKFTAEIESIGRFDQAPETSNNGAEDQSKAVLLHNKPTPEVSYFPLPNNANSENVVAISTAIEEPQETTTADSASHAPSLPTHRETDNKLATDKPNPLLIAKQIFYRKIERFILDGHYEKFFFAITGLVLTLLLGAIIWTSPEKPPAQAATLQPETVTPESVRKTPADSTVSRKKEDAAAIQQRIEKNLTEHDLKFEYMSKDTIKLQLNIDEQFSRGNAIMSPAIQSTLTRLAQAVHDQPHAIIHIIGHCDLTGSQERNTLLSKLRAKVAANFLVLQGIPQHRLTTEGRGADEPISLTNPQLNRRIDLLIETLLPSDATG